MICPVCNSNKYIKTGGKKLCMGCGYEETIAENPALFKTQANVKQPIERKHDDCDNTTLRVSRVRLTREGKRIVYVCDGCDYEEEHSI